MTTDLLADVLPRTPLPYTTRTGHTVTVAGGVIYLNAVPLRPVDALDLSCALARAVNDVLNASTREVPA
ncbi:hypothetical protein [Micromonospora sediminicola]|uniref:hypothetical protein n=1 Tax=Micromonospora sediminicola TaxID=946078 RepID=UPI0037A7155E